MSSRLPRSGNAALGTLAFVQALIGLEFVLAGLSKAVDSAYTLQFSSFVQASPGAKSGPLAGLMQALVVPNLSLVAQLSQATELIGGAVLLVTALEVLRRRFSGALGAQHAYEPLVALLSAVAALALGGMSLTIYLLEGGRVPMVDPGYAFTSPIAIELMLVPIALAIAWIEVARFLALVAADRNRPLESSAPAAR